MSHDIDKLVITQSDDNMAIADWLIELLLCYYYYYYFKFFNVA